MQNDRRPSQRPMQGNYRGSRARQRAQNKMRKKRMWTLITAIAILVIFFIIRSSSRFTSWVWLFVAGSIWLGIVWYCIQRKTTGDIIKIEIINTIPHRNGSTVVFRETTESGLVRIAEYSSSSVAYMTEMALMNTLENTEVERKRRRA